MQITNVGIDCIKPYIKNPRKNSDSIDKVAASIRDFGFKQPIVVDAEGIIIAGHTRWKAAKQLGLAEVPVIYATDLTEDQAKAYRLADNKTAEFAEWDADLLAGELQELDSVDFDMEPYGFESFEPVETQEDDYDPTPPEEPTSELGAVYQLGRHRLMCGDSTNLDDVEKLMDGTKVKFVFTDPPWNVNYGADLDDNNPMGYKTRSIMNDSMSTEDFHDFMSSAFKCMNEASEPGAMTYVVMSAQEWGNMMLAMLENDYHWSSTIIWSKDHAVLSRKDYHTRYEPIWYGWKNGAPRLYPLEDRTQNDVWDIDRPTKSDEHPTMKPVELVARAMQNSSKPNDKVLDLFGGSGTTLIAAEQTNRAC